MTDLLPASPCRVWLRDGRGSTVWACSGSRRRRGGRTSLRFRGAGSQIRRRRG